MAKLTPEKLTAFCAALAETCNVGRACQAVGISRTIAYEWKHAHPEFAERWERAMKIGLTALEDEANRRAFEGDEQPVFKDGEKVGSVRKYSDTLAIFLLKAHDPDKYRENSRMELAGVKDRPLEIADTTAAAKIAALMARAEARKNGLPEDGSDLA